MLESKIPLVMLINDKEASLASIEKIIQDCGYHALLIRHPKEALDLIKKHAPDLIILDAVLPDIDGFETCKLIKSEESTQHIPIIFISSKTDNADIVKGFHSGAVDYIKQPFDAQECFSRIKTHMELKLSKDKIAEHAKELETTNKSLNQMIKEIESASKIDFLTGLYNRNCIIDRIQIERIRFKRNRQNFAIVLADVDHFKSFNTQFGYDCGDYLLKSISKIFMESLREQDYAARWGGEQFLLFLPDTKLEGAKILVQKLRLKIANYPLYFNDTYFKTTLTFGLACYDDEASFSEFINRTELCLEEGKIQGRDCISYRSKEKIFIER